MNLSKVLRTFLIVIWCMLVLPLHAFHELTEEHHTEIHHCDESSCISKFNPECELCLFQQVSGITTKVGKVSYFPPFSSKAVVYSPVSISKIALRFPKNKAPPIS